MLNFNLKKWRDRDPGKFRPAPFRDWRRLIVVWGIGLVIIFVVAGYLTWQINLPAVLSISTDGTMVGVSQVELGRAKKIMSDRNERYQMFSQTPPVSIDPGR